MASTNAILALSDDYKIYSINTTNNTATKVHDTPAATATYRLMAYQTNVGSSINVNAIFYFYGNTAGLYNGTTFTDNWLGTVPAGAGSIGSSAIPFVWQNFLMIGYTTASSNYIAKFDGTTGANGTLTTAWFDLGASWAVKSFFNYYNYLGVVIYNLYSGENQILLLDGSSTTLPVKRISVPEYIVNSLNVNNDLIFITTTGIKHLGDNGLETIKELSFENKDTIGSMVTYAPTFADKLNNKIYFSHNPTTGLANIFSFAKKDSDNPYITSKLYDATGANSLMVRVTNGLVWVSSTTATTYYLQYFSTGNSTATLKFPFKDFGQKVRINYVKFYFKPLVASDSITVGLDADYGKIFNPSTGAYDTSITLKDSANASTISATADGVGCTSKKFKVGRDCFSFRPTLSWTTGGTSLAFVVVDYDFINDV
jgi:hypothetical protein